MGWALNGAGRRRAGRLIRKRKRDQWVAAQDSAVVDVETPPSPAAANDTEEAIVVSPPPPAAASHSDDAEKAAASSADRPIDQLPDDVLTGFDIDIVDPSLRAFKIRTDSDGNASQEEGTVPSTETVALARFLGIDGAPAAEGNATSNDDLDPDHSAVAAYGSVEEPSTFLLSCPFAPNCETTFRSALGMSHHVRRCVYQDGRQKLPKTIVCDQCRRR